MTATNTLYTRLLRANDPIAELTEIGELSVAVDDIEVTNYDSDVGYKEYIPGMYDGGELSITGNLTGDDAQAGLESDYQAGTLQDFIFAFPNSLNSSWGFSAYVKNYGTAQPIDGALQMNATLKISGKPVLITANGSAGLTTPYFTLSGNNRGSISPSPSPSNSIYLYSATADNLDTAVTITPTAAAGSIYVNGTATASGSGESVSLGEAGTVTKVFIVVKESNKAPKIYKINITRAEV